MLEGDERAERGREERVEGEWKVLLLLMVVSQVNKRETDDDDEKVRVEPTGGERREEDSELRDDCRWTQGDQDEHL